MKFRYKSKTTALLTAVFVLFTSIIPAGAQILPVPELPPLGTVISTSARVAPPLIKGIRIIPDQPLAMDFIIDVGEHHPQGEELEEESRKLIKYFLATLTIPEEDLWVNLSPYEENRIIPQAFGYTEMGRDLLAQDYLLKQITASLLIPDHELGKKFWERVRAEARARYGVEDIPMTTLNKIWIVPEKAVVYENGDTAIITESYLKVMLEGDYMALRHNLDGEDIQPDDADKVNDVSAELIREIVIPAIEQEINEGEHFIKLRQIYHSMILATWYKETLKESLLGQVYVDQNRVGGVNVNDPDIKDRIYEQYTASFQQGVYEFIKEEYDPVAQEIVPRKYFTGGVAWNKISENLSVRKSETLPTQTRNDFALLANQDRIVEVNAGLSLAGRESFQSLLDRDSVQNQASPDRAMIVGRGFKNLEKSLQWKNGEVLLNGKKLESLSLDRGKNNDVYKAKINSQFVAIRVPKMNLIDLSAEELYDNAHRLGEKEISPRVLSDKFGRIGGDRVGKTFTVVEVIEGSGDIVEIKKMTKNQRQLVVDLIMRIIQSGEDLIDFSPKQIMIGRRIGIDEPERAWMIDTDDVINTGDTLVDAAISYKSLIAEVGDWKRLPSLQQDIIVALDRVIKNGYISEDLVLDKSILEDDRELVAANNGDSAMFVERTLGFELLRNIMNLEDQALIEIYKRRRLIGILDTKRGVLIQDGRERPITGRQVAVGEDIFIFNDELGLALANASFSQLRTRTYKAEAYEQRVKELPGVWEENRSILAQTAKTVTTRTLQNILSGFVKKYGMENLKSVEDAKRALTENNVESMVDVTIEDLLSRPRMEMQQYLYENTNMNEAAIFYFQELLTKHRSLFLETITSILNRNDTPQKIADLIDEDFMVDNAVSLLDSDLEEMGLFNEEATHEMLIQLDYRNGVKEHVQEMFVYSNIRLALMDSIANALATNMILQELFQNNSDIDATFQYFYDLTQEELVAELGLVFDKIVSLEPSELLATREENIKDVQRKALDSVIETERDALIESTANFFHDRQRSAFMNAMLKQNKRVSQIERISLEYLLQTHFIDSDQFKQMSSYQRDLEIVDTFEAILRQQSDRAMLVNRTLKTNEFINLEGYAVYQIFAGSQFVATIDTKRRTIKGRDGSVSLLPSGAFNIDVGEMLIARQMHGKEEGYRVTNSSWERELTVYGYTGSDYDMHVEAIEAEKRLKNQTQSNILLENKMFTHIVKTITREIITDWLMEFNNIPETMEEGALKARLGKISRSDSVKAKMDQILALNQQEMRSYFMENSDMPSGYLPYAKDFMAEYRDSISNIVAYILRKSTMSNVLLRLNRDNGETTDRDAVFSGIDVSKTDLFNINSDVYLRNLLLEFEKDPVLTKRTMRIMQYHDKRVQYRKIIPERLITMVFRDASYEEKDGQASYVKRITLDYDKESFRRLFDSIFEHVIDEEMNSLPEWVRLSKRDATLPALESMRQDQDRDVLIDIAVDYIDQHISELQTAFSVDGIQQRSFSFNFNSLGQGQPAFLRQNEEDQKISEAFGDLIRKSDDNAMLIGTERSDNSSNEGVYVQMVKTITEDVLIDALFEMENFPELLEKGVLEEQLRRVDRRKLVEGKIDDILRLDTYAAGNYFMEQSDISSSYLPYIKMLLEKDKDQIANIVLQVLRNNNLANVLKYLYEEKKEEVDGKVIFFNTDLSGTDFFDLQSDKKLSEMFNELGRNDDVVREIYKISLFHSKRQELRQTIPGLLIYWGFVYNFYNDDDVNANFLSNLLQQYNPDNFEDLFESIFDRVMFDEARNIISSAENKLIEDASLDALESLKGERNILIEEAVNYIEQNIDELRENFVGSRTEGKPYDFKFNFLEQAGPEFMKNNQYDLNTLKAFNELGQGVDNAMFVEGYESRVDNFIQLALEAVQSGDDWKFADIESDVLDFIENEGNISLEDWTKLALTFPSQLSIDEEMFFGENNVSARAENTIRQKLLDNLQVDSIDNNEEAHTIFWNLIKEYSVDKVDKIGLEKLEAGIPLVIRPYSRKTSLESLLRSIGDVEVSFSVIQPNQDFEPLIIVSRDAAFKSKPRFLPFASVSGHTHGYRSLEASFEDSVIAVESDLKGKKSFILSLVGEVQMSFFNPQGDSRTGKAWQTLMEEEAVTAKLKEFGLLASNTYKIKADKEDAAMLIKTERPGGTNDLNREVGGIDLNPSFMNLERRGSGVNIELPANMKSMETLPMQGFVPVINSIGPVTNLPLLLGQDENPDQHQPLALK